ncbi:MAG: PTS sugar transporter subunit IIB [Lactobacillus sp.]|jgi:PTS system mannose-specific IIB component|nr:PTS sugar transporter subunit IIB [Lactobacillus sp.]
MEIMNVRVDSRGIHGQVQTTWIPKFSINRIMVIDDDAVKDATQKMALKLAKPEGTKLSILSTEKAYIRLTDPDAYPNERTLVLFEKIDSIKKLADKGYHFDEVTLGNIPNRENTKKIQKTINLTPEEISQVNELHAAGTKFIYQMVPNDQPIVIDDL